LYPSELSVHERENIVLLTAEKVSCHLAAVKFTSNKMVKSKREPDNLVCCSCIAVALGAVEISSRFQRTELNEFPVAK